MGLGLGLGSNNQIPNRNAPLSVKRLALENVGPIRHADIEFGDLTILVGPQATGKTIYLQFLKLIEDISNIVWVMNEKNVYWDKDLDRFLQIYLGEGMHRIWSSDSKLSVNDEPRDLKNFINNDNTRKDLNSIYIPAQRFLTLENGWPRAYKNYIENMPYVVREFSDVINAKLETFRKSNFNLFPMEGMLDASLEDSLSTSIFEHATLTIKQDIGSYRVELSPLGGADSIPLNVISAGQREFIPYLYGLFYLMPAGINTRAKNVHMVIIEELEMGLHPKAIGDAFLTVMALLNRGYRVVLSTHSSVLIDYVWALVEYKRRMPQSMSFETYLCKLFGISASPFTAQFNEFYHKIIKLYYFKPQGEHSATETVDISSLDVFSDNPDVNTWGDLTAFSSRVGLTISELDE